ncbi:MAG: ABC transporter substrate-binding protein, partial [Trebonia sp.]
MRWSVLGGAAAVVVLLGTAPSSADGTPAARAASHATVTFALPVGEPPNYIFPLAAGNVGNNVDLFQFSPFLFRPLYWYGKGASPNINFAESMAGPPKFSNRGRTVTITLDRRYRWSDGAPVTNRDVRLWMELLTNEKQNYLGYAVGSIPDDITASSYPASSPYQFSLTFNRAYSSRWILYNQLSEITPLPAQTMDRTSASGPVGNHAATRSGAVAVYNFLDGQSKDEATYASNPLW